MVLGFKSKLDAIDELIKTLRDKIEHSATYLGLLVEGVSKLVDFLKEKKKGKANKKKEVDEKESIG